MSTARPERTRSYALGAAAVLVLALLVSLMLFVGQGGCTSAVAFDRPREDAPSAVGPDVARASALGDAATEPAPLAVETHGSRGAAVQARAPVRGVVVDAATGELVPHVELVLTLGPHTDRIDVGADGRFDSSVEFPSGRVRAVVRDDGAEVGQVDVEHDATQTGALARVAVPIGPTIPFRSIDGAPAQVGAWRARIVETALAPDVVAEIDVVGDGLVLRAPSAAAPDRAWSWRTLRAGDRPWIRYARHEHAPEKNARPALEIRDDVANRKALAVIESTVGIQPPPKVATRAFAKARLHLARAPEHEKLALRLALYDMRDGPIPGALTAPVFDEAVVDEKGDVVFDDLEGGTKHVVGWSREERVDEIFLATEGPSDVVELRAKRAEKQEGATVGNDDVPWFSADRSYVVTTPAAAKGRMRGWLSTASSVNGFLYEQLNQVVAGVAVRIVLGDFVSKRMAEMSSARFATYRFEGRDRSDVEIAFGPSGSFFPAGGWEAERPLVVPERLAFTWSAWRDGMRPVFGHADDAQKSASGPRRIDLDLQPGWGAQIVLRAGAPEEIVDDPAQWTSERVRMRVKPQERRTAPQRPAVLAAPAVPGVTVRVDGFDEATSDAGGELRLSRALRPERLTLIGRGWRITALEKLPGKAPRYVAWLRRNP